MSIPSFLLLDNSSTERFAETSFPVGKVTGPPFGARTVALTCPHDPANHQLESVTLGVPVVPSGLAVIGFLSCVRFPGPKPASQFQLPLVVLQIQ